MIQRALTAVLLILVALVSGCAHRGPTATAPLPEQTTRTTPTPDSTSEPTEKPKNRPRKGGSEKGLASWYGEPYHGRRTASGEIYDMHEMTAAHRTLAFGTVVRVTRRDTGADVKVRITDRGPFIEGRIIDLSFAAAKKIGLDIDGLAPVRVVVVGFEQTPKKSRMAAPGTGHPEGKECMWVQVGAFGDKDNARRAERRLEDAGETAVVIEGPNGLNRVRVGPFDRVEDAEKALERIRPAWPAATTVPCG